jgi:threonine dehydrogenase-like Zn-dependent dehydrogenase
MAEYVTMPWWITYQMPAPVSFEDAALVEPAGVSMHAVRITAMDVNDLVVVIGAGIGLLTMQGAKIKGAGTLVVMDVKEDRLAFAKKMGADVVVNSAAGDPAEALQKAIGRPDADVVFEAVGLEATVAMSIRLTKLGGTLTLIGNVTPKIQVNLQEIISREVTIRFAAIAGEYPAPQHDRAGAAQSAAHQPDPAAVGGAGPSTPCTTASRPDEDPLRPRERGQGRGQKRGRGQVRIASAVARRRPRLGWLDN